MDFNGYPQRQILPQENQNARPMVGSFTIGARAGASEVDRHQVGRDFDPSHYGHFPTGQANGHPYPMQPQAYMPPQFMTRDQNANLQPPPTGVQLANVPYGYQVESQGPYVDNRQTHVRHDHGQHYAHPPRPAIANVGVSHGPSMPTEQRAMSQIPGTLGSVQHPYAMREPRGTDFMSHQVPGQAVPPGFDHRSLSTPDDDALRPFLHPSSHNTSARSENPQYHAGRWARGDMPSGGMTYDASDFDDSTMASPMSDQSSPTTINTFSLPGPSPQLDLGGYPNRQTLWSSRQNFEAVESDVFYSGLMMAPHGGSLPPFGFSPGSFPPTPRPNRQPAPPPDRGRSPPPPPRREPLNDTPPQPPDDQEHVQHETETLESTLLKAFPSRPDLRKLADHLLEQKWLQQDGPEPSLDTLDELLQEALHGVKDPDSSFEAFFDPTSTHRCRWYEYGKRCPHTTRRKDRAVGHSRSHFQYKPFQCKGKCGKKGCIEKYTCHPFMKDHINRKKNPKRACSICGKSLLAQNISRHRKKHHPEASSPGPATLEDEEQAEIQDASQNRAGPSKLKRKTWEIIAKFLRSRKGFD